MLRLLYFQARLFYYPQNKGASTLVVLARLVLIGRLVWLLLVLVNLRPHYFSCLPGFGA
jgi:RsiW-degrading membrane proteinase PrsW (M82 family)